MVTADVTTVEDGHHLPVPDPPFTGIIAPALRDSISDFPEEVSAPPSAPNILLMMTDDVGFGTASTFGGPVRTATMDKLAAEGIRYNRFHTTAMCSPTRASLLTGRQPHNASTGYVVDGAIGFPGYNGMLPKSCATIAQVLKNQGYATSWFGKNHNTPKWQTSRSGPFDRWPTGLGFDYFYGFLGGDTNQFAPNLYENTTPVHPYMNNDKYHLDEDMADKAIAWLIEQTSSDPTKPFFMYYAPGSTHAPHHVPEMHRDDYKDEFKDGWDALREKIHSKQIDMGIIPPGTKNTERPSGIRSWDSLETEEEKEVMNRMMEIYAAFLDYTDRQMGRILDEIKRLGREDNTLVIYIQGDNGGSAEGTMQGSLNEMASMGNGFEESMEYIYENRAGIGGPMHYNHFPVPWAWALNAPMQWSKRYASHFGGTRNGMVMKWPLKFQASSQIREQFHHVSDIAPTIFEAAGVKFPITELNGIEQKPLDGVSMTYTWDEANKGLEMRRSQVFEMDGNRGMYKDGWMACTTPIELPWEDPENPVPDDISPYSFNWELYNVRDDFSQGTNMADSNPEKLKELTALWWDEARKNQILPMVCSGLERALEGDQIKEMAEDGRDTFTFYNGTAIPEGAAPSVKGVSHKISCFFEIPEQGTADGVIVAQGGRFGGFGLVIFDNKPTWVYKASQNKEHEWKWTGDALTSGPHKFDIVFKYRGGSSIGGPGTYYILHDDVKLGSMDVPMTVSLVFSLTETLDIGKDTGTPLLEDYAERRPFNYTGKIEKVVFNVNIAEWTPEVRKAIAKRRVKMLAALD